jgi:hypothetical protein
VCCFAGYHPTSNIFRQAQKLWMCFDTKWSELQAELSSDSCSHPIRPVGPAPTLWLTASMMREANSVLHSSQFRVVPTAVSLSSLSSPPSPAIASSSTQESASRLLAYQMECLRKLIKHLMFRRTSGGFHDRPNTADQNMFGLKDIRRKLEVGGYENFSSAAGDLKAIYAHAMQHYPPEATMALEASECSIIVERELRAIENITIDAPYVESQLHFEVAVNVLSDVLSKTFNEERRWMTDAVTRQHVFLHVARLKAKVNSLQKTSVQHRSGRKRKSPSSPTRPLRPPARFQALQKIIEFMPEDKVNTIGNIYQEDARRRKQVINQDDTHIEVDLAAMTEEGLQKIEQFVASFQGKTTIDHDDSSDDSDDESFCPQPAAAALTH